MEANVVEKAFCVLELSKSNCVTVVQRRFGTHFGKSLPARQSIYDWRKKSKTTECLCKGKNPGRPSVCDKHVERVRGIYQRSSKKSTARASLGLQIPQRTVRKILRKLLKMNPYKLQFIQILSDQGKLTRRDFCTEMQERCEEDDFSERLILSDESTFHISGKVNKQNVRIWGTENPRATVEHVRDSPKVNVFCAMSFKNVYGPFFFQEKTAIGASYLDTLIN
jgi:DNA-dependent RNA polymerase auxiliary subunit epsilon